MLLILFVVYIIGIIIFGGIYKVNDGIFLVTYPIVVICYFINKLYKWVIEKQKEK